MKKIMNIIFSIAIPTMAGYATFFLIYYLYQKVFFEYRLLAAIPLTIVTGYIVIENRKEWKMIKQQG
jgi:hypothetical protein